jgi:hypothetical protein
MLSKTTEIKMGQQVRIYVTKRAEKRWAKVRSSFGKSKTNGGA